MIITIACYIPLLDIFVQNRKLRFLLEENVLETVR